MHRRGSRLEVEEGDTPDAVQPGQEGAHSQSRFLDAFTRLPLSPPSNILLVIFIPLSIHISISLPGHQEIVELHRDQHIWK